MKQKVLIGLLAVLPHALAWAQLRVSVNADAKVYVYSLQPLRIGQGFHVFRKDASGSETKLTGAEPIQALPYGTDLPAFLGRDYNSVREALGEDNPVTLLYKLRADRVTGNIYAFAYPRMAAALGQLFVDSTATMGQTVTYRFQILDMNNRPKQSYTQTVTLGPNLPLAPQDLQAERKGHLITLKWSYPEASEETDDKVSHFHVYRMTGQKNARGEDRYEIVNPHPILRNASTTSHSYVVQTQLVMGKEVYRVLAQSISGQLGEISEPLTVSISDQDPPEIIPNGAVSAFLDGSMEFTWPASVEPDVIGYNVYRSPEYQEGYEKINSTPIPPKQTVYVDKSALISGKAYYYSVTAVDATGNESQRSNPAMEIVRDKMPPPTPRNLRVDVRPDKQIEVTWEAQSQPADLKGYLVLRRKKARNVTAWAQISTDSLRITSWMDGDYQKELVEEGHFYQYGVLAADYALNFSDTTIVTIRMPDVRPPEPPASALATNEKGRYINLTWLNSPSGDVTRYRVSRSENGAPYTTLAELGRVFAYRDEQIIQPNQYVYRIEAVDSLGNVSLPVQTQSVVVDDQNPPREVRNVRVFPREGYNELIWEPVVAADLAHYRIYRADDLPTGQYRLLVELDPQTLTFRDFEGRKNHWYKVMAVDTAGNESKAFDAARPYLRTD